MSVDHDSGFTRHVPPPCLEEVQVLYVDDHILVVNKPAGLLSVPGRFLKDSVLHRMLFEYPDAVVVHRLDLDTSGLLVLALSKKAVSDLNRQFRERSVRKYYEALVWGHVPDTKGLIELPIRPDPNNRPRQIIDHAKGKAAQTRYRVINIGRQSSRLRLQPITGRSHQLRIHLASIGYPILGCDLYAHRAAFEAADRLMLHATNLRISHPTTLESLDFRCPAEFSVTG